jgi:tRNA 2-thiocytidine biosynthesis protein TtcA
MTPDSTHTQSPFIKPSRKILSVVGKTLIDHQMIQQGDRLLIALSGGKDSFSLLHILLHFQRSAPVKFELGVATLDPMMDGFDPSPLKGYMEQFDLPYHFVTRPVQEIAGSVLKKNSLCSLCSRVRRGALYATAREHGYNVLALGQHLDDIAESFLMSLFHEGKLNTMKAHYLNDSKDIRIIRPLIGLRERQLIDFAKLNRFPLIQDRCIGERQRTRRDEMKQLLSDQESHFPMLFKSINRALRPLISLDNTESNPLQSPECHEQIDSSADPNP